MEIAQAYIPMDRRHALAKGENLPERTQGAALFADISGFTPLTAALAKELGALRGAEELARQLNRLYSALIGKLYHYQGSVISFSGDAITCWLDQDDGRRAIACALQMQEVMAQFGAVETPAGTIISLGIKVAVACGPVRRFLAGDPQVCLIDVLAGQTLDQMAAAEKKAKSGDVVVTAEIVQQLGMVEVSEWRGEREFAVVTGLTEAVQTTPWPVEELNLSQEQVKAWLLPSVYERLKSLRGFFAELRPAVAFFIKFEGLDYDQDDGVSEKLDAYMRWVQAILSRYEGSILQLNVGDKGSYLYSAFGIPIAHHDDAIRAVGAALALQKLPPDLSFIQKCQIGLARGRLRVGAYGSESRLTYAALGNKTNVSARLMSIAQPGQVYCDVEVYQRAKAYWAFDALPPVPLKGKKGLTAIYRPTGQTVKSHVKTVAPDSLVGRQAEVTRLDAALDSISTGQSSVLMIEGGAGIGKSRLIGELISSAEQRGLTSLLGTAHSIEQQTPYRAWRDIFTSFFEMDDVVDLAKRQQRVQNIVQAIAPEQMPRLGLLNDVLNLELPESDLIVSLEPSLRQKSLVAFWVDLLRISSQQKPLILVIEDTHWLDKLSWELTEAVVRALLISKSPFLFVLTTRFLDQQSIAASHFETLQALPETETLSLNVLSDEAIIALACKHLKLAEEGLPAPLATLLCKRAEGNPLFTEELLLNLRDQKLIRLEPSENPLYNRCLIDDELAQASSTLPETLQGLILARVDRLPLSEQVTLKVAAVIGHTFGYQALYYTLNHYTTIVKPVFETHLKDLIDYDLTKPEQLEPDLSYIFKHMTVQEVAYQTLLFSQKQELHKVVANVLEQQQPDDISQIAYHTFAGEDWPRALHYMIKAGKHAQQLAANHQSIDYFQNALSSAQHLPDAETISQRLLIRLSLGELFVTTSQYEPAQSHLEEALTLATEHEDDDAQARACRFLARSYELRAEYTPALEWIEKGLTALQERETSEKVELLLMAGLINIRRGEYDKVAELCQRSLEIANQLNATRVLARTYNLLGLLNRRRGNTSRAVECYTESLTLYQLANDIYGQAISHNQIATAYFHIGRWGEAAGHYQQAHAIFSQTGDIYREMSVKNNLGLIAMSQGRLDAALTFFQDALDSLAQIGSSLWVIGMLHINLAQTFIRKAEADLARQNLQISEQNFLKINARGSLPELYRLLAEVALLTNEYEQAQTSSQKALTLARDLSMQGEEGSILRVQGQIAYAQGQLEEAEQCFKESLTSLNEADEKYEWARSQFSFAHLSFHQGHKEEGLAALAECIPIFERLEAALDLEKAHQLQDTFSS